MKELTLWQRIKKRINDPSDPPDPYSEHNDYSIINLGGFGFWFVISIFILFSDKIYPRFIEVLQLIID